jgi:hypothetical protein
LFLADDELDEQCVEDDAREVVEVDEVLHIMQIVIDEVE